MKQESWLVRAESPNLEGRDMVNTMADALPDRTPARRPGSGVPVDPGKLTWMRSNRELTRDGLSDRITQVAIEQQILDNHENPVTYSRDAVAKLENGERHPKTYTFRAIVAALGCNPEDLLVDFPGTKRRPEDPDLLTGAEIAAVLGDAADPIDILKGQLTTRAWNSVGRSGFLTIGEVSCALQSGELRDTPNLGHVQMNEIRSVLSAIAAERTEPDEDETDEDAGSVAV